eukprot:1617807-Rhodomonas_salina.1
MFVANTRAQLEGTRVPEYQARHPGTQALPNFTSGPSTARQTRNGPRGTSRDSDDHHDQVQAAPAARDSGTTRIRLSRADSDSESEAATRAPVTMTLPGY